LKKTPRTEELEKRASTGKKIGLTDRGFPRGEKNRW